MEEKNELNDIILNKNDSINNNKKIILSVATLGVILIIVIVLMNNLSSDDNQNLPQPTLPEAILPPPEPTLNEELANEPLFQEVEVLKEEPSYDENLDLIAKKLKEESVQQELVIETVQPNPVYKKTIIEPIKKTTTIKNVQKPKETPVQVVKKSTIKQHYIQVGSFSIYKPNKKFLQSITDNGFSYKFHEVKVNNKSIKKVLVGPFGTKKAARNALKTVRKTVINGAFLVQI